MTDGLIDGWMAGQKCMSRNTGQENMFSCMAKGQEKSFPDMKKRCPGQEERCLGQEERCLGQGKKLSRKSEEKKHSGCSGKKMCQTNFWPFLENL